MGAQSWPWNDGGGNQTCIDGKRGERDFGMTEAEVGHGEMEAGIGAVVLEAEGWFWIDGGGKRRVRRRGGLGEQGGVMRGHPAVGAKKSVYALSMDAEANIVAVGSPEAVLRIIDARTGEKLAKLRGHTDNIRCALNQPVIFLFLIIHLFMYLLIYG